MHLHGDARLDSRHERVRPGGDVQQDLRAERLDDIHRRVEDVLGRIRPVGEPQRFGTHAERGALAGVRPQGRGARLRNLDPDAGGFGPQPAAGLRDRDLGEIHRRGADEPGHELVGGLAVQSHRLADLLHDAVLHHHHAVAEGHRLDLVVGHVDRRGLQSLVQPLQLDAHLHPELGVQVG